MRIAASAAGAPDAFGSSTELATEPQDRQSPSNPASFHRLSQFARGLWGSTARIPPYRTCEKDPSLPLCIPKGDGSVNNALISACDYAVIL